ncbi:MAG: glycosyltransferase family 4 protein [Chloroflexi bacterium]|nr:glycosyltransferase family 4 protein [Chloroflexota bacterium]
MTSIEILRRKPVYFYTDAQIAPDGQGSSIRVYTNLRAYLDLGFYVEIIQFVNLSDKASQFREVIIPNTKWVRIDYFPQATNILKRSAYFIGFPKSIVLDIIFPIKPFVVEQIRQRDQLHPDAIHHFEYDDLASAAVDFKNINSVWSNLDILSTRVVLLREMRKEFSNEKINQSDQARMQQLRDSENLIARHIKLILSIASHEHDEFRNHRKYKNAEFFPMSWPDEDALPRRREWVASGVLRLLHLGSVDGFLGYDSLKFILEKVFPLLPKDKLNSIELLIVGQVNDSEYSQHISKLAKAYPQVKLLGYVEDLKQIYSKVDLQVVGGTRATGLRTRIIESFVYGLPVLSTWEAAKGVMALSENVNVLLATDPLIFANKITEVLLHPELLPELANRARQTYDQYYSRKVAAEKLQTYLENYF